MRKQNIILFLAVLMCLALGACANTNDTTSQSNAAANPGGSSSNAAQSGWNFNRRIEIMVPSPEGSNADITIRAFSDYLSEEMGTDVLITNMAGASGVTGYTWARDQEHDGYFFQYTSPSAIGAAVLGNFDFDFFEEITPLAGLLDTSNVIFAGKAAPFSNYEELSSYAAANPGKVSIAVQSTTGIDGASMGQFLSESGLDLNMVNYESEATVACISGQVNLIMNSYGECEAYVASGDLIPIVILDDKGDDNMPGVPCTSDVGVDAKLGPWFGFTCFNHTPKEAQEAFLAAVEACAKNPKWIEFLERLGYSADFACGAEEFGSILDETATTMDEAFAYFTNAVIK